MPSQYAAFIIQLENPKVNILKPFQQIEWSIMKEWKAGVGMSEALRTALLRWEWTHWVVGGDRYPIIIQANSWDLIIAQRLKFIGQNPPLGLQTSASHHGQNYLLSAVLQSITLTELIHPKKQEEDKLTLMQKVVRIWWNLDVPNVLKLFD